MSRGLIADAAFEKSDLWPTDERSLTSLLSSVSPSFARILPKSLALEFTALACRQSDDRLIVAIAEAPSDATQTRIERATSMRVQLHVVASHLLAPEIARCYGTLKVRSAALADDREEVSLASYIDVLFERAVLERASDIHIDGLGEKIRIRFRIDGCLKRIELIEPAFAARLVSRIKLLAGIDISERRVPQDGRLSFAFESRSIDVRVASILSESGERLALRIFDREAAQLQLEDLAFSPTVFDALTRVLQASSGFFMVCGPTGSGKSTTLYTMLRELYSDERHICTVEDPVEKVLPGITQVPIHTKSGVTFAHALRALLRQDPDVLMIGEVRDQETAQTAFGAALSGQLVLSTVHGADIARGIDRLCELGLSRTTLLHSITGIMTQRLVRRLCKHCRRRVAATSEEIRRYGFAHDTEIYRAHGCERCDATGYRGRIVLADIVVFHASQDANARETLIGQRNLFALLADARRRCIAGETSIDEIHTIFLAQERGPLC